MKNKELTFSALCKIEPRLLSLSDEIIAYARENPNQDHLMKWLSTYKKRMCLLVGDFRKLDYCDSRLKTSKAYDVSYAALTSHLHWGNEYECDHTDYTEEEKELGRLLWDKLSCRKEASTN